MLMAIWDQLLPYVTALWARRWFRLVCYFLILAIVGVLRRAGILN
jgi:hypothetical protein